ncbi:MAG: hypothetical protein LBS52_00990 [Dysgonamonadaceae bacterium]|jgi:transcriptional regulator of arginine metabolism|nr:hypothetical protein [Dysgonamonadaceae bacterium]
MKKNDKQERQDAIGEILRESAVGSQDDLMNILIDKGFELTQATLSRDFREMKIAKTPDTAGNYVYRLPAMHLPEAKSQKQGMICPFYRNGVLNIEFSGQMAVVKTPRGYAQGVAQDIDANQIPGVMATIAGNDTLMLVLRENADKLAIINSLKILFSKSN